MQKLLSRAGAAVFFSLAIAGSARAQLVSPPPVTTAIPPLLQTILETIPPPPDDPLLDANGNVVLDANGQPVSDPNEAFHQVKPQEFDPAHTDLVQAAWLNATGCPSNATVAVPNSDFTAVASTTTYTDGTCAVGDPKDQHNEGLLLVKTGPSGNFASATAELKKVRGMTVTSVGYDIRKPGFVPDDPRGSHCGAGAPRFLILTQEGGAIVIGCNSPPPVVTSTGQGWQRLRWAVPATTVQRILIIFDEGQDTGGPDQFGAAILDNVAVNEVMVGHGPTDAD